MPNLMDSLLHPVEVTCKDGVPIEILLMLEKGLKPIVAAALNDATTMCLSAEGVTIRKKAEHLSDAIYDVRIVVRPNFEMSPDQEFPEKIAAGLKKLLAGKIRGTVRLGKSEAKF